MKKMTWQKKALKSFTLYGVTDLIGVNAAFFRKVEAALLGGIDVLQLRSKVLSDRQLYDVGKKFRELTKKHHKLFMVNDRPDLAVLLDADGVHVGQDDLPIDVLRRYFRTAKKNMIIGRSTHSLKQALAAQAEGVDYIGVGPVFKTPTKKHYTPVGLRLVEQVRAKITIPFVCIGGINKDNLAEVRAHGGSRVAVVRAVFDARNVTKSARALKEMLN